MGVFERSDSPFFYVWYEGLRNERGQQRERTPYRRDAATPEQRKKNRAAAESFFHKRMTELADGTVRPGRKPSIAFRSFAAWFATHVLPERRGREREAEILPRLVSFFGDLPLTAVDREKTAEYATFRKKPTRIVSKRRTKARTVRAGTRTINREIDVLKSVLQAAVPKYLDKSPLYGMKRLWSPTPQRHLMSEEDERRLLAVMDPDDKALFLLALDSLVRMGDVLDVKRTDYHQTHVWIASPKTGEGFDAPISARTREAIEAALTWRPQLGLLSDDQIAAIHRALAQPHPPSFVQLGLEHGVSDHTIRKYASRPPRLAVSEFLFPRRRVAKTDRDRRNGVRQMLERYCAQANIPFGRVRGGLSFHWATRRTGATRMLTRGVDPGTAQKVGRWKRPDVMLSIYHELIDEKARAAVEAVGATPGTLPETSTPAKTF